MNKYRFWDFKILPSSKSATRINLLKGLIKFILICCRGIVFLGGTLSFYVPGILVFKVVDYLLDNIFIAAILSFFTVLILIALFFFLEGAMLNRKRRYQNDYAVRNFNFLFRLMGPLFASVVGAIIVNLNFEIPIWASLVSCAVSTIFFTILSMSVLKPVRKVNRHYLKPFFEYGKTF